MKLSSLVIWLHAPIRGETTRAEKDIVGKYKRKDMPICEFSLKSVVCILPHAHFQDFILRWILILRYFLVLNFFFVILLKTP